MSNFLEKGKYYTIDLDDEFGNFKVPFFVKEINVYALDSEDDFENILSDEGYRDSRGFFNHDKFDCDYDLFYAIDIEDREIGIDNFTLIENKQEIEKAKQRIKSFTECKNEYLEAIASRYPEY